MINPSKQRFPMASDWSTVWCALCMWFGAQDRCYFSASTTRP